MSVSSEKVTFIVVVVAVAVAVISSAVPDPDVRLRDGKSTIRSQSQLLLFLAPFDMLRSKLLPGLSRARERDGWC